MNTILLQKILDLLKDNLTGAGTFIKSVFVHDPQDNQILSYDAEIGKWVNKDATEVELELTNTFEAQPIATLTDGAENVPMKSLVVDIVPKQASGTPTPDNPLPITGFSEVNVTKCGINIWNELTELGNIDNATGEDTSSNSILRTKGYIDVKPNTSYYFKAPTETGRNLTVFFYDENKNFISLAYKQNNTETTPQNAHYMRFKIASAYGTTYNNDISINYPSSDTQYHAYNGTTFTIALGQTVYGGEVDVVSGSGTITKGYIESYNGETINEPWISSMDVYTPGGTPTTGAQVVYPLTTPTALSTTPTTIKTKGGTESIFSDCGNVSGEYYTKTAESVLALANITDDITSSITKNTTDFSDILLKVSRNNKVVSIEIYSATTAAAVNDTFLSNLPKPAMNSKVLLVNTTLGEDGTILGTLKTSGELEIATSGAKSFSGLITYVAK